MDRMDLRVGHHHRIPSSTFLAAGSWMSQVSLARGTDLLFHFITQRGLFDFCQMNGFRGYLGPGGRHDASKYSNCTGGATMYVDHKILGEHHTSRSPSYQVCNKSHLNYV